jgi:hypothetical protein
MEVLSKEQSFSVSWRIQMVKQDSEHMPEALTDLPAGGFGWQSIEAGG